MRILVTGGSGFIGTNLIEFLRYTDIRFINIDINPPKIQDHNIFWRNVDIRNFSEFSRTIIDFSPTHIIHLAATTGIEDFDLSYFSANTDGVSNLVEICNSLKSLERVIFTSSLLVCKNGYIPQNDVDYCPSNSYGSSKVIGEKIVRDRAKFSWVIVRPTAIWGPWFQHSYKAFFSSILRGYYLENQLVGFTTVIRHGNELETYFLGYDDTIQREKMLYLNMLYDIIGCGIIQGFERIILGRTALEIKSSIGAIPVQLNGLMRHTYSLVHRNLSWIFPLLEPEANWIQRHPFKD
jgi:nucleoside-diphosphate-sugar epimerase